MLETGLQSFDEIAYSVGYEDSSFFRKVFVKHTGLRPSEYKAKFNREYPCADATFSEMGVRL
jgi:YesN/AraC family two-component response regulator